MTSDLFDYAKDLIQANTIDIRAGDVKALPVTALYTPDFQMHAFLDDVPAVARAVTVDAAVALTSKVLTVADSGTVTYDADDVTFTAVRAGEDIVAVVLFLDTGEEATSTLIGYFDNFLNLPLPPDGRDVIFSWAADANRIFSW